MKKEFTEKAFFSIDAIKDNGTYINEDGLVDPKIILLKGNTKIGKTTVLTMGLPESHTIYVDMAKSDVFDSDSETRHIKKYYEKILDENINSYMVPYNIVSYKEFINISSKYGKDLIEKNIKYTNSRVVIIDNLLLLEKILTTEYINKYNSSLTGQDSGKKILNLEELKFVKKKAIVANQMQDFIKRISRIFNTIIIIAHSEEEVILLSDGTTAIKKKEAVTIEDIYGYLKTSLDLILELSKITIGNITELNCKILESRLENLISGDIIALSKKTIDRKNGHLLEIFGLKEIIPDSFTNIPEFEKFKHIKYLKNKEIV